MARCAPCNALADSMPTGDAHADLVQTGTARRKYFAQAAGKLTLYRCKTCGQEWEHESDKNDMHAGWSLVKK